MTFHGFVAVQARGVVALPAEVRRRLHLDEPGAQVEITEREDGVLELRPTLPVPADQRWFWQDRWQQRENEVDKHVAAGHIIVHGDGEGFLDHLDQLDQLDAEPKSGEQAADAELQP
jgi:AbrB family looped-hinge helix DNA binding protein